MITEQTSRNLRVGITILLMAASAVCALKYSWWAAGYSGWYGLPGYAQDLRIAATRANFYWWSVIVLQAATVAVVWSLVQLQQADMSQFLKRLARFAMALGVTVVGTGVFVGLLILVFRKV